MSMQSLWVGIDSRPHETRILATAGPVTTVLKARLLPSVAHPRAVPTLLEALALWQGVPVRAALVVDDVDGSSATRLGLDSWAGLGAPPLYEVEFVPRRRPHHRDSLDGMGPFHDLRQLVMFEVAR
jgi:hypothetical protein